MEPEHPRYLQHCSELANIIRTLCPELHGDSWDWWGFPDRHRFITETEMTRLGIQFHHVDIETGAISPPATQYFLPRADLPEIPDNRKENLHRNCLLSSVNGKITREDSENHRESWETSYFFPHCLSLAHRVYSFEGDEQKREFWDRYVEYSRWSLLGG